MPQRKKSNYEKQYFFCLTPWKISADISFLSWVQDSHV